MQYRQTRRPLSFRQIAIILLLSFTMLSFATSDDQSDRLPFNDAHFASTHNSYSGDMDGRRGSIIEQLDHGIRCIELDIHNDDFTSHGYRLGHDEPGHVVCHDGSNPDDNRLSSWLRLLSDWSDKNPDHAPITVYLDIKDNFGNSYAEGNLAHLNKDLVQFLGDGLYRAEMLESSDWPTVGELRGKFIVVFTGCSEDRLNYLHDRGSSPTVAMNGKGQVIEVHDSGDGDLWYWTGQLGDDLGIRWRRHGRYGSGKEPAVAVNDRGLVVEVHNDSKSGEDRLRCMLGELDDNYEIQWRPKQGTITPGRGGKFNSAVTFVDTNGRTVRVSYRQGERLEYVDGVIEPDQYISWRKPHAGVDSLPDRSVATSNGHTLQVSTGSIGPFDDNTLIYRINDSEWRRIQYEQVAFVGFDDDMPDYVLDLDPQFIAADARNLEQRERTVGFIHIGRLVRLWRFNDDRYAPESPVNFPATDFPFSDWYTDYCQKISCIR